MLEMWSESDNATCAALVGPYLRDSKLSREHVVRDDLFESQKSMSFSKRAIERLKIEGPLTSTRPRPRATMFYDVGRWTAETPQ